MLDSNVDGSAGTGVWQRVSNIGVDTFAFFSCLAAPVFGCNGRIARLLMTEYLIRNGYSKFEHIGKL